MSRRNYGYYSYSRRRSFPWATILIALAVVAIVAGILVGFNYKRIKLMMKGYSWKEASIVLDMSDTNIDTLLKEDKIDNLVVWMEYTDDASYYDEYDQYAKLFPKMDEDKVVKAMDVFVDEVYDGLKDLGYKDSVIWELLETQSNSELKYLINHNLAYSDISDFVDYKYFKCSNVTAYKDAVAKYGNEAYAVNITNFPFIISEYEDDSHYTILDPDNITTLVKKGFYYDSDYVPDDLREVNIAKNPACQYPMLRDEAATALEEMTEAAKLEGYYIVLNSGYRSYSDQSAVYSEYEAKYGGQYAAEYVAAPGASEHQSGLGVDLTSQSVVDGTKITFGDTAEYQWVIQHCQEYGFIIRFEEAESNITGIAHEPWHLRYVGKDAAEACVENDWTYEEYCLYNSVLPEIDY